MLPAVFMFAIIACLVSLIGTWLAMRAGRHLSALDNAGVEGQVKMTARPVPNTGGIGIALAIILTLAGAWVAARLLETDLASADVRVLAKSAADHALVVWTLIAGLFVLHVMGVIDDRKALDWKPKLGVMFLVSALVVWLTDTRVLELLDPLAHGSWLSILITVLWFVVIMNAMNFLDNMDGLAGGLGVVISGAILAIASMNGQWFIAAGAATLLGATIGFLPHNFPRARVFMGDGGSLAIGYMLAFLTVRLNFVESAVESPGWHQLFVPLVLLSIPLYDFTSVVAIRLAQGKSPFVGDLQHFSHRMARRGMGRTGAVIAIWTLAGVTCAGAVVMSRTEPWQGALVIIQTASVLMLIAFLERGVPEQES